MTTHYRHGDTSACTARIKPPSLTRVPGLVDCGNCERTHAYQQAVRLPPVPTETRAAAADVPVLTEWLERLAS